MTAISEPAAEPVVWLNYSNPTYGYSLEYPNTLSLHAANDEYVQLGEKIEVAVWDIDPGAPLGDGPAIERETNLQLAGRPARLFEGYIGSVGGYVPQRFKRYVVQTGDGYFLITLYALGLGASEGSLSQIAELDPADIQLFDTIAASVRWPRGLRVGLRGRTPGPSTGLRPLVSDQSLKAREGSWRRVYAKAGFAVVSAHVYLRAITRVFSQQMRVFPAAQEPGKAT